MKSGDRKVNEFVKRVRSLQIHVAISSHLRAQLPAFGKQKAQAKLVANPSTRLAEEFARVQRATGLAAGDFPDPRRWADICGGIDLAEMPKPDPRHARVLEDVLANDLPKLLRVFDNPYAEGQAGR